MKQFLYGRLFGADKDFSYYITPRHSVGLLTRAINSDRISGRKKLLVLQNKNGVVSFGIREQLTVADYFGRPRKNFLGFQLEAHENANCIPFFDALAGKFDDITSEAHRCHELLDKKPRCGDTLQDTPISFSAGTYQAGNAWNEAVMQIRRNPHQDLLLMFDDTGRSMAMDIDEPQVNKNHKSAPRKSEHSLGVQSSSPELPKQATYSSSLSSDLGIERNKDPVAYDDLDKPRIVITSLPPEEHKKAGVLTKIYNVTIRPIVNVFKARQQPEKSNIPFVNRDDYAPKL